MTLDGDVMKLFRVCVASALFLLPISSRAQGALATWLNKNDMSPVPLFYQDNAAPALLIADVCCTNGQHGHQILGMSPKGQALTVLVGDETVIEETLTLDHDKDFIAKVLSYDPSVKLKNSQHLEIKSTTLKVAKLDALDKKTFTPQIDEVVYRDPETPKLLDGWVDERGVFTYLIEGVAYATNLEVTESSSRDIIAGLGATPDKCTTAAADKKDTDKNSDKDKSKDKGANKDKDSKGSSDTDKPKSDDKSDSKKDDESDKDSKKNNVAAKAGSFLSNITKYFGGAAVSVCTNESGHVVLNSKTPVPIGMKVVKVYKVKVDAKHTTGLDYTTSLMPNN